jgi:hypothetical protein
MIIAQERRTIIIENVHQSRGIFHELYSPIKSSLQFVTRIFDKQENFVRRLKNKIFCNRGRDSYTGFAYYRPFIYNNDDRIVIRPRPFISDRNVIINRQRDIIILNRKGRRI